MDNELTTYNQGYGKETSQLLNEQKENIVAGAKPGSVRDVEGEEGAEACTGCCICLGWACLGFCPLCTMGDAIRSVREYERAMIFRLGKLQGGPQGPGMFIINPLTDTIVVVDLRIRTINLPPQEMITKDSVTVTVDAIVLIQVTDPTKAVLEVDDYYHASSLLAATQIRSAVGSYELDDLLMRRDKINAEIKLVIDEATDVWGVKVVHCEVKDVKLPRNMQRAMASQAESERERRAKVIAAKGEFEASEKLKEAAMKIAEGPGALQLRYLQTLRHIATEQNSTVVFPLPMNMMKTLDSMVG